MSRKSARETVYKLIFEYLFSKKRNTLSEEVFALDNSLSPEDKKYIEKAYPGVIEHFDELTGIIASYSEGFTLDRIYKPDLAALLLSIYELKFMKDVPPLVSISEALELVKAYSTDKSSSFVHGILAEVKKDGNH